MNHIHMQCTGCAAGGATAISCDTVLPAGASQGASSPCILPLSPVRWAGCPSAHRLEAGGYALAGCQCHMVWRSHPYPNTIKFLAEEHMIGKTLQVRPPPSCLIEMESLRVRFDSLHGLFQFSQKIVAQLPADSITVKQRLLRVPAHQRMEAHHRRSRSCITPLRNCSHVSNSTSLSFISRALSDTSASETS